MKIKKKTKIDDKFEIMQKKSKSNRKKKIVVEKRRK